MIEFLDPAQPWEIPVPITWEDHDRLLEARHHAGAFRRWGWTGDRWLAPSADPEWTTGMEFSDIVKWCLDRKWRLYSIPAPAEPAAPEHETESDDGGN